MTEKLPVVVVGVVVVDVVVVVAIVVVLISKLIRDRYMVLKR